jgi:hypothetical protein
MSVANNHARDAGPESVAGTAASLAGVGVDAIGLVDARGTPEPVMFERSGLRVAMLAFDLTRQSPAGEIAHWEEAAVAAAVLEANEVADLVAVSLHGGVEYLPAPDQVLAGKVEWLASLGVDVVWAHGAHVPYDVVAADPDEDGRVTVMAYGLGNFVFDQRIHGTNEGLLLEVLAGRDGVRAYRVGTVRHDDLRVSAPSWHLPEGSAVLLDGEWWQLAATRPVATSLSVDWGRLSVLGDVTAAGRGDADGDGSDEIVAAFLRPLRPTLVNQRFGGIEWADAAGRSAHLGIYTAASLRPEWVAGSVLRPIVDLAACDGALSLAFRELDGAGVVATGAWWWRDFGFAAASELPGSGAPACHDVDADGHTDAVVLRDPAP